MRTESIRHIAIQSFKSLKKQPPYIQRLASDVFTKLSEIDLLQIKDLKLRIKNWHSEHSNLHFLVFSDLHANKYYLGEEKLNGLVQLVNQRKPNFVLMLGDFLFGRSPKMPFSLSPEAIGRQLGQIEAPKYAVLGNHDHIIAPQRMYKALDNAGVNVLSNESVEITENGKKFFIAGVDDYLYGQPNIKKALSRVDKESPVLLLSHNPDIFDQVPQSVSLTLAGHTHNLQVKNKFLRWLIKLWSKTPMKYPYGKYTDKAKTMFVSQGIGVSAIPVRKNIFPEILDLTLEKK